LAGRFQRAVWCAAAGPDDEWETRDNICAASTITALSSSYARADLIDLFMIVSRNISFN
jgi:hypothetical protein